jgi:hypothetical protein
MFGSGESGFDATAITTSAAIPNDGTSSKRLWFPALI